MKVLVFDTETTGLPQSRIINPDTLDQWPHIVQFSFIIYDTSTNIITDNYDHIIRVDENVIIPAESASIHRVTKEISNLRGVELGDVFDDFFYHLETVDMIVGHNIEFDINIVRVELLRMIYKKQLSPQETIIRKYNLHKITHFKNIFCTLKETVDFCNIQALDKFGKPYVKYPKLIELHEKLFATLPSQLHNAMVDILVTLRCFVKIRFGVDILTDCRTFKRFVKRLNIYE